MTATVSLPLTIKMWVKKNFPPSRRTLVMTVFVLLIVLRLGYAWGTALPGFESQKTGQRSGENQDGIVGLFSGPRHFLEERLMHVFREPKASLAAGILLGTRTSIPYDLKMDFKAVGLMHVVAVSGFNMVIIVAVVTEFLMSLGRRRASILAIPAIVFFTLMVGASAAVVRAAVMSALRLIAWLIGRPQYVTRLFLVSIGLMLIVSPELLFQDIGFQLSAGATAGLIWLARPIQERVSWIPERFGLRENFSATLAATLITTPIVGYHFGTFSILSIPINLLVVPLVAPLMLGSFLSLLFGAITANPTSYLFSLMIFLVQKGAAMERSLQAFLHTVFY